MQLFEHLLVFEKQYSQISHFIVRQFFALIVDKFSRESLDHDANVSEGIAFRYDIAYVFCYFFLNLKLFSVNF